MSHANHTVWERERDIDRADRRDRCGVNMPVTLPELKVSGRFFKLVRLRHEWFEYLDDPQAVVEALQQGRPVADVFTFLQEAHYGRPALGYHQEIASASVLTFGTYKDWWTDLHFKVRNKIGKVQKKGVELRATQLDDRLVRGVQAIYDETPIRQGRRFPHYGKSLETIREDLSSFPERTCFIGAYHGDELIGFMKLFQGTAIVRTVHSIAKLAHRDKSVMDGLIARAVEVCDQRKTTHFHYGDWATCGLGAFRAKFGFERQDCPRYYVSLTARGKWRLNKRIAPPAQGPSSTEPGRPTGGTAKPVVCGQAQRTRKRVVNDGVQGEAVEWFKGAASNGSRTELRTLQCQVS